MGKEYGQMHEAASHITSRPEAEGRQEVDLDSETSRPDQVMQFPSKFQLHQSLHKECHQLGDGVFKHRNL